MARRTVFFILFLAVSIASADVVSRDHPITNQTVDFTIHVDCDLDPELYDVGDA